MKWPWKRKQSTPVTRALGVGDGAGFRHPLDPPLSPRMTPQESRDAVRRAISELYEHGALDAGNGDVVDAWIDQLKPQWLAHQRMVSADRAAAAQLAAGEYEAAAVAARRVADAQKAEVDHIQRLVSIHEDQLLGPRQVSPLDHADLRRRQRPTLSSLEGLTSERWWTGISFLLLLVAASGDYASFNITLQALLADNGPVMVSVLTFAMTAAAMGLMHALGRTSRSLKEGRGGLGRIALSLMAIVWLVLGAAAFYIRTQVQATSASTSKAAFRTASAVPHDERLLSAVLLGALFLAAGLLAFWIGFTEHHPRMSPYRKLRNDLSGRQAAAAEAERQALEAERLSENSKDEIRRTADRNLAATQSVDAEIAELKELARLHIAGLVGEPSATNNLVTGRSVQHPDGMPPPDRFSHPYPVDPVKLGGAGSRNGNGHHGQS